MPTSRRSAACRRPMSRAPPNISTRCARSSSGFSRAASPTSPRTTCCSRPPRWTNFPARRAMARWRAAHSMKCWRARASRSPLTSATRWISCCGSRQNPASRAGRVRAAYSLSGGPAGISNARQCRWRHCSRRSAAALPATILRRISSTFTAAASIWSSRTMKTRSRNRAARLVCRAWRTTGCTTASCKSKARKCRRASAIS